MLICSCPSTLELTLSVFLWLDRYRRLILSAYFLSAFLFLLGCFVPSCLGKDALHNTKNIKDNLQTRHHILLNMARSWAAVETSKSVFPCPMKDSRLWRTKLNGRSQNLQFLQLYFLPVKRFLVWDPCGWFPSHWWQWRPVLFAERGWGFREQANFCCFS